MSKQLIDATTVRVILDYDELTGDLRWRANRSSNARAGTVAGHVNRRIGYRVINLAGSGHYAHRLIWLHVHGVWPTGEIDHINGDRKDNRLRNLRDVTHAVNLQNRKGASAASTVGFLGVRRCRERFQARVETNGRTLHLGTFDSAEEAHAAYLRARPQLPGS